MPLEARTERERLLLSMIATIERQYREAIRPYVDQLVRLRALDPAPRMIFNPDDLSDEMKERIQNDQET